jgi:hypothetical protein
MAQLHPLFYSATARPATIPPRSDPLHGAGGGDYINGVYLRTEAGIGTMIRISGSQRGASAVGTAILLAIAAYGVYVGIQYVPQMIESSSVGSILNSIEHEHRAEPIRSAQALRAKVDNHLNVNQLNHLKDSFSVREFGNEYIIEVSYERELNLLYETRTVKYENSLTLH